MNPSQPNKKPSIAGRCKTLGLSEYDDERILYEIKKLINSHKVGQPYSRNTLLRIKDLLERNRI